MPELLLGPLLRHVDGTSATVWVETGLPCTAEVHCADGARGESRTFQVAGHHYALVTVTGLTPGTSTAYQVLLGGERVWPLPDSAFPPSVIRTPTVPTSGAPDGGRGHEHDGGRDGGTVRVAFGSCRWAAPPADGHDPVGPDALDTLASRIAADPDGERPDLLVLLGDQVYADEISEHLRDRFAARRDLSVPPGAQVTDYEEYTQLYRESWLDPEIRWLLSTVPSCMIFDDHDVVDDWNTSASWLAEMRATDWWHERVISGLMSYWVHQHLGNLSPAELAADPLYLSVHESADATLELRKFAERADADPTSARWSYRRDLGRVRLLMVDSRAARVLDEDRRAMLDPDEAAWLREQVLTDPQGRDHLLVGTSLPWLMPRLVHDVEAWDAALCRGERGPRWARFGERLRRTADLEHWSAFPDSFAELAGLLAEAGSGPGAPATICVLSGDVHHAYVAEPSWPNRATAPDSRVLQLTCSPVHNSVPGYMRLGFRFGWTRLARGLGRLLARHGSCASPAVNWRKTHGPWFGNQLMTLELQGRSARLRLEQATTERGSQASRGGQASPAGRGFRAGRTRQAGQTRLRTVEEFTVSEA